MDIVSTDFGETSELGIWFNRSSCNYYIAQTDSCGLIHALGMPPVNLRYAQPWTNYLWPSKQLRMDSALLPPEPSSPVAAAASPPAEGPSPTASKVTANDENVTYSDSEVQGSPIEEDERPQGIDTYFLNLIVTFFPFRSIQARGRGYP